MQAKSLARPREAPLHTKRIAQECSDTPRLNCMAFGILGILSFVHQCPRECMVVIFHQHNASLLAEGYLYSQSVAKNCNQTSRLCMSS